MEVIRNFFRVLFLAFSVTFLFCIFLFIDMPRYYRRRYTKVVRPKKKWATNIVNLNPQLVIAANTALSQQVVCQNANPTNIPTPTILKTGNFKVQCDAYFNPSTNTAVEFAAYIMYVPEGITLSAPSDVRTFIEKHPEWIMAWKYGSYDYISSNNNIDSIRMSSRLKRNLNSGDKIMFFGLTTAGDTGSTFNAVGVRGMVQYWTCAN